MTHVRIKVAKSELMPCKPIFAKIAVSAANTAEATAQITQGCVLIFLVFLQSQTPKSCRVHRLNLNEFCQCDVYQAIVLK